MIALKYARASEKLEIVLDITFQRITGTLLHKALRAGGHRVGVTLVREYLREERRKAAEVYVPLVYQ